MKLQQVILGTHGQWGTVAFRSTSMYTAIYSIKHSDGK